MLLAWVVALRDAILAVLLGFVGVDVVPAHASRGEAAPAPAAGLAHDDPAATAHKSPSTAAPKPQIRHR